MLCEATVPEIGVLAVKKGDTLAGLLSAQKSGLFAVGMNAWLFPGEELKRIFRADDFRPFHCGTLVSDDP